MSPKSQWNRGSDLNNNGDIETWKYGILANPERGRGLKTAHRFDQVLNCSNPVQRGRLRLSFADGTYDGLQVKALVMFLAKQLSFQNFAEFSPNWKELIMFEA